MPRRYPGLWRIGGRAPLIWFRTGGEIQVQRRWPPYYVGWLAVPRLPRPAHLQIQPVHQDLQHGGDDHRDRSRRPAWVQLHSGYPEDAALLLGAADSIWQDCASPSTSTISSRSCSSTLPPERPRSSRRWSTCWTPTPRRPAGLRRDYEHNAGGGTRSAPRTAGPRSTPAHSSNKSTHSCLTSTHSEYRRSSSCPIRVAGLVSGPSSLATTHSERWRLSVATTHRHSLPDLVLSRCNRPHQRPERPRSWRRYGRMWP